MKTYRQGDILIIQRKKLPANAEAVKNDKRGIVLAEGEATGHAHRIKETDKAKAYKAAEGFYLTVEEQVDLVHDEHARIALAPGTYEVIHQVDFRRAELQRVVD
jgi:hypothetical protein